MVDATARKQIACLAVVGCLIALGWVLIALLNPNGPYSPFEQFVVGLLLGTILGQVSLSAAWCVLGPFALMRRLPLSTAWIGVVLLAVAFNISREPGPPDSGILVIIVIFGGALLGQWLLVQIPLWLLVVVYGLRIQVKSQDAATQNARDKQFGIRQLMIITAIVALLLGVGRFLFGQMTWDPSIVDDWEGFTMFGIWAVSSALMAFPVIGAALLRRWTVLGIAVAIGLVAGVTVIESQAIVWLTSPPPMGAYEMFFWTNGFQCLWILVPILVLRAAGYRLNVSSWACSDSKSAIAKTLDAGL